MQHRSTKEIERKRGDKSCASCENCSAQGCVDGAVEHFLHRVFAVDLEIFADAVEDHYRIVDTITHYGQQGSDDLHGNFFSGQREHAQDKDNVESKGQDGHQAEGELEADPDVNDHQNQGDYHRQDRVGPHFGTGLLTHSVHFQDHFAFDVSASGVFLQFSAHYIRKLGFGFFQILC